MYKNFFGLMIVASLINVASAAEFVAALAPPEYQVTDKFGVNLAAGQVTTQLATVAIGGERGLSHSISTHHNSFIGVKRENEMVRPIPFYGGYGYTDKYAGIAQRTLFAEHGPGSCAYRYVMRVNDISGSADFEYVLNGTTQCSDNPAGNPSYTFKPLRDERHSLVREGDDLVWTKPDGTVVRFVNGRLSEIEYPNGFTLTLVRQGVGTNKSFSVITNTGFQLQYIFEDNHRPIAAHKAGNSNTNIPPADSLNWSTYFPKYVSGINRAVEVCDPACTLTPELTQEWPTATFHWPDGMPRAFFIGESQFRVTDAQGRDTIYYIDARDKTAGCNDGGTHCGSWEKNKYFVPRITAIKEAHSTTPNIHYEYRNHVSVTQGYTQTSNLNIWYLASATGARGSGGYSLNAPLDQWSALVRNQGAYDGTGDMLLVDRNPPTGNKVARVTSKFGTVTMQTGYKNEVDTATYPDRPDETYLYQRGNITAIQRSLNPVSSGYPTSCSEATKKICNQPLWVEDGRGSRTHYTYHADSGQVATITSPANENGKTAQTRFEYEEKKASYLNSAGILTPAAKPIWLKTAEKHCADSNYTGSSCEGNDEVVTRYEYNSANLFLTGMTVTAGGVTHRTCYEYDRFGNRIGETQPNANLSSCNG